MFNLKYVLKKTSFLCGAFLCLFLITQNSFAQTGVNKNSNSPLNAEVKIGGISPTVGISYQVKRNTFRTLAFFTVGTKETANNQYLLDVSYTRNWKSSNSLKPYWGLNLNLQFKDPIIGPGLLFGSSYQLSKSFSLYGEAGLNIYFIDSSDSERISLFNSGIGIRVNL